MAIDKKLIHFNKKEEFEKRLNNDEIKDSSIVFIKDSKEIYTHGEYYGINAEDLEKISKAGDINYIEDHTSNTITYTIDKSLNYLLIGGGATKRTINLKPNENIKSYFLLLNPKLISDATNIPVFIYGNNDKVIATIIFILNSNLDNSSSIKGLYFIDIENNECIYLSEKTNVDLSNYPTFDDIATTEKAGVMTKYDKSVIDKFIKKGKFIELKFLRYDPDYVTIPTIEVENGDTFEEDGSLSFFSDEMQLKSATTSTAGVMSADDKAKLDGIDLSNYVTKIFASGFDPSQYSGNSYNFEGLTLVGPTPSSSDPYDSFASIKFMGSEGNTLGYIGIDSDGDPFYYTSYGQGFEMCHQLNTPIRKGSGQGSIIIATTGTKSIASGKEAIALGGGQLASGDNSLCEGTQTTASGISAHAEGNGTQAEGNNSHSEGYMTTASGQNSHAEGDGTIAEGYSSHAEGYDSLSQGEYSHAEGNGTTAEGFAAHSEGEDTHASGYASHTSGMRTFARNMGEAAFGVGNVTTYDKTATDWGYDHVTLFTVGNGDPAKSNSNHNAFEVRQNGDVYIPDTNAEGEYYKKPMIHLQEKLQQCVSTSGNQNISGNKEFYSAISMNSNVGSSEYNYEFFGITLKSLGLLDIMPAIRFVGPGKSILETTSYGCLGMNRAANIVYSSDDGKTRYTLLHEGNWSNYIKLSDYLPLSGGTVTGQLNAPRFDIVKDNVLYVIIDPTHVRPNTANNGKINLGMDGARWAAVYSDQGVFTNQINITSEDNEGTKGYYQCGKMLMRGSSTGNLILSSNANTMYFRPNGTYLGTGQATLSTAGVFTITGGQLEVANGNNKFTLNVTNTIVRLKYNNQYGITYDAITVDGSDVSIYTNTGTINLMSDTYCTGEISARNFSNNSDKSLKEDIVNADDLTTEKIASAPLVRFKWKDNGKDGYGTLAQYWQEALPDVVSTTKQGTLSIDTARIGMASAIVLARDVKKLQQELNDNKEELDYLKRQIIELKQQLSSLRNI